MGWTSIARLAVLGALTGCFLRPDAPRPPRPEPLFTAGEIAAVTKGFYKSCRIKLTDIYWWGDNCGWLYMGNLKCGADDFGAHKLCEIEMEPIK